MIESKILALKPEKDELKKRLKAASEKLSAQQIQMKTKKVPVIVLVEGWGTSGKGSLIGSIINNIDPRFFKVASLERKTDADERFPFLYRFFREIPENGKFVFMDSGWMNETVNDVMEGKINKKEYRDRIACIRNFERQLVDNGYLLLKVFLHISKKEQKNRIKALEETADTSWRVDNVDVQQNKHYDECFKVMDQYMEDTESSRCPWYIVDSTSRKWAQLQVTELLNESLEVAMQNMGMAVPVPQNVYPLVKMPKLSDISLDDKFLTDEEYDEKLKELQTELRDLHNRIYRRRIPVIIAYEGWDAAGKGGNIKRITAALDPRGYEVNPIASPEPHEKARHFLWRFYTRLPKSGHIGIFDRTWYGRVMVERLEGFCTENEWKRAFNEMNEFEKDLTDSGAVVIKFWVQIDKDTQLERFTERQNSPEKSWKITDEDWRNREKWDLYEPAIDEMIEKTSTTFAPWYILESKDKKYARIKAMEIVIDRLTKALKAREEA